MNDIKSGSFWILPLQGNLAIWEAFSMEVSQWLVWVVIVLTVLVPSILSCAYVNKRWGLRIVKEGQQLRSEETLYPLVGLFAPLVFLVLVWVLVSSRFLCWIDSDYMAVSATGQVKACFAEAAVLRKSDPRIQDAELMPYRLQFVQQQDGTFNSQVQHLLIHRIPDKAFSSQVSSLAWC